MTGILGINGVEYDLISFIDPSTGTPLGSAANPLNVAFSGGPGGNASVGVNASTAPTSSTQFGFLSGANLVPVSATNPLPISGTISATNPSVSATGATAPSSATLSGAVYNSSAPTYTTGQLGQLQIDVNGNLRVSAPAGGATSALQTSGNASLTTLSTNLPAQGQALAAASMPVVLTALQVTALTPPATVTVQPLKGTPSVDIQAATISHASKGSAGALLSAFCQNTSAGVAYLQFWDGTLGSGTLKESVLIAAGVSTAPSTTSLGTDDWTLNGLACATSINWGLSSTATTYIAIGSATGFLVSVKYQ